MHPIAIHKGLNGYVGVWRQRRKEAEMCGIVPLEAPGWQGGAYLGHILERRIIKFGALEISYMTANTH